MKWGEDNIQVGALITRIGHAGFTDPLLIGWRSTETTTAYGLIDLRDGMFMQFGDGSKQVLAEHLSKEEYMPAIKMKSNAVHDIKGLDNRMDLPVVVVHRLCKKS